MTPLEEKRKQYTKIAHMMILGTPQNQIAEVMGFADHTRISQIKTDPLYMDIEAQMRGDKMEQTEAFNNSWDGLEAKAMENLATIMDYNKDPMLMLSIAKVANAAKRRGGYSSAPAVPGGQAKRASVGLPASFVAIIQQTNNTMNCAPREVDHATQPQQRHNILAPGAVQQMFNKMSKENDLLGDALAGLDPSALEQH